MGKWIGYHLTIGPGDRNPAVVAADLRTALPEAIAAANLSEYTDPREVYDPDDPRIWHEDGIVHWTSGRRWSVAFDFWDGLVPALDVPGEWALGLWQMEVEYYGGGRLFAYLDGRYVEVDEFQGRYGRAAEDVVTYFDREWDVTGAVVE